MKNRSIKHNRHIAKAARKAAKRQAKHAPEKALFNARKNARGDQGKAPRYVAQPRGQRQPMSIFDQLAQRFGRAA